MYQVLNKTQNNNEINYFGKNTRNTLNKGYSEEQHDSIQFPSPIYLNSK